MVAGLWARNQLVTKVPDEADTYDAEFDEAAAALGLVADGGGADQDCPDQENQRTCYLWPCNVLAWNLWLRLQTQWRVGVNGREGLDYGAVVCYMEKVARIKRNEFAALFSAMQTMEHKALAVWDSLRP